MDIEQIKQGQKDWVKVLNYDLSQLNVKSETADIITANGWTRDTSNPDVKTGLRKYYLLDGSNLILCQLSIKKSGVMPNETGDLFTLPNGYSPNVNYLPSIPVDYSGHVGGFIKPYFAGNSIIGYRFIPANGNVDSDANKANDLTIETTLMWIAN